MIATTKWGRRLELTALCIAILAIPNFLAMMIAQSYIGGSAFNGYTLDGHFFVGSHARYTEVSPDIYAYSWWHNFFVTIHYIFMFTFAATESLHDRLQQKRSRAANEKDLVE